MIRVGPASRHDEPEDAATIHPGIGAVPMGKLKPMYLYRLRLVLEAPRFYAPSAVNAYLERRGLIARTGRADAEQGRTEYAITGAGREALAWADQR